MKDLIKSPLVRQRIEPRKLVILLILSFITIGCNSGTHNVSLLQFNLQFSADADTATVEIQDIIQLQSSPEDHTSLEWKQRTGHWSFYLKSVEDKKILYQYEMNTLVEEYQATPEAKRLKQQFNVPFIAPCVEKSFLVEVYETSFNSEQLIYAKTIHLDDWHVETASATDYPIEIIRGEKNPDSKLDIVVVAEGYTAAQMDTFMIDARQIFDSFFTYEPFKTYQDAITIWAVKTPSEESGCDIPQDSIYKNTRFNSSFNTLNSDRYLTVPDINPITQSLSSIPYDHLVVLINTDKYGGAGFYNHYSCLAAKADKKITLLVHEFGHAFGGLGDEYYKPNSTTMGDFTALDEEPLAPNLTTLRNFTSKWKHLVKAGTPIPTPNTEEYKDAVGAFEGGGYEAKGVYRPMQFCMMKELETPYFCPACQEVLIGKLLQYIQR